MIIMEPSNASELLLPSSSVPRPHPRSPASHHPKSCLESGWYGLWRGRECGPTLYPALKTPVTVDVLEAGLYFAAAIIFVSLLVLALGVRGHKTRWFFPIRCFLALSILTSILLCNFGQEWEVSELYTKTPYRAGVMEEIHAHVGVKIGLRSINVTLKAEPEVVSFKHGLTEERINYNERYHWNNLGFDLGRAGFGQYAGLLNREFRASQWRGTPLPILWVAEYFTLDGEGIRWGRHYQLAGWYAHIMMWLAFPLWVLSLVLFYMVISYGAVFSFFTGLVLGSANLMWVFIRNPLDLDRVIPFEDGHMRFHYGWCFWLNMATAILCAVIGVVFFFLDWLNVNAVAQFLNKDIQQEYEDVYVEVPAGADVESIHEDSVDRNMLRSFSQVSAMSANSQLKQYLVCHYQRRRGTASSLIAKLHKNGRRPSILRSAFSRDDDASYTPDTSNTPRPSFQLDAPRPPRFQRNDARPTVSVDDKRVSWNDSTGIYDNVTVTAEYRERLMRQRSSADTIYEEQEMDTMREVVVEVEAGSPDVSMENDTLDANPHTPPPHPLSNGSIKPIRTAPLHSRPTGFPNELQPQAGATNRATSQHSHADSLPDSLPQSPTIETPCSPPPHTANLLNMPLFTNARMGSTSSYLSADHIGNSTDNLTNRGASDTGHNAKPPKSGDVETYPFSLLEGDQKGEDGPKALKKDTTETLPSSVLEEQGNATAPRQLKTEADVLDSHSQSSDSTCGSTVQIHKL